MYNTLYIRQVTIPSSILPYTLIKQVTKSKCNSHFSWRVFIMVSAPLVLTALGIIFILQIITIIQVVRISALVKNKRERTHEQTRKPVKKYRNARESQKPNKHQARSPQPKGKPPVTSVDKSLRDINLRLKNAERDQERARKKLGGSDSQDSGRKSGRDRDQGRNRGRDRDRDQGRDRDRDQGRNRDRDRSKKPIQRRNRDSNQNFQRKPSTETAGVQPPQSALPTSSPVEEVSLDSLKTAPVSEPNVNVTNSSENNFGRGTKISVKRRTLEDTPQEETSIEQSAVVNDTPASEEQEINFGRR